MFSNAAELLLKIVFYFSPIFLNHSIGELRLKHFLCWKKPEKHRSKNFNYKISLSIKNNLLKSEAYLRQRERERVRRQRGRERAAIRRKSRAAQGIKWGCTRSQISLAGAGAHGSSGGIAHTLSEWKPAPIQFIFL